MKRQKIIFSDELAWEALSRITKQFPGEVTIVAIGPLTNVAIGEQYIPFLVDSNLEQRVELTRRIISNLLSSTGCKKKVPFRNFRYWTVTLSIQYLIFKNCLNSTYGQPALSGL